MMTILAAVNDIFFYTKLRDALKPLGYHLARARSQPEVSEQAAAHRPAAAVLDMNDPALDGLTALECLRTDPRFAALPVLAFANHEEVATWQRAKALGVTRIVSRNEFSSRTRDLVTDLVGGAADPQPSAPAPATS